MTSEQRLTGLLELVGAPQPWRGFDFGEPEYGGWSASSRLVGGTGSDIRTILIRSGPRDIKSVQKMAKRLNLYGVVAFKTEKAGYGILLRTNQRSMILPLGSEADCEHTESMFRQTEFGTTSIHAEMAIEELVDTASVATTDFINRGVFSNHYLKNRLLAELERTRRDDAEALRASLGDAKKMVRALRWKENANDTDAGSTYVIVSDEPDLGMAGRSGEVAPSYLAVTELARHVWVILTNGRSWRLYTDMASASTTTYFEINLGSEPTPAQLLYMAGIFGRDSYDGSEPLIRRTYDGSQKYARSLEGDLATGILRGGIFLNMVKGLLDHDGNEHYTDDVLEHAKSSTLKVLYRILFVLYAEARDILLTRDKQYREVSIDALRSSLEELEADDDGHECWARLLGLFSGISEGDPAHNIPQYNGDLFAYDSYVDGVSVRNKFIVPALRGLLERDGESIDYAILEVRHLGSIYERLLEFSINQAKTDIVVYEDFKRVHVVETSESPTYKKNDLYLASKEGLVSRKTTASYYTPSDIVQFLVRQGLKETFRERDESISADMKRYRTRPDRGVLRKKCIDHITDIQVLDPAMGSGHFLVEALNQITTWATGVLTRYPDHPLWDDIRQDRNHILHEQKSRNIHIDDNLLTATTLLKRRIMKRCIFGVDVNPLAVDLAKLSLWLDSFAIGTPLTYMGHHIKCGDSTIGMWLGKSGYKYSTLDDFPEGFKSAIHMKNVSSNPDLTIEQVRRSQSECRVYGEESEPHKRMQDVLTAQTMSAKPTQRRTGMLAMADRWDDKDVIETTKKLNDKHRFFHWELEMVDAFTDGRDGFDLIVGNPPWAKTKPEDRDFFSVFDPDFYSLKKPDQKKRIGVIMQNNAKVGKLYDEYLEKKKMQSRFYSQTYERQGGGDKDLWQLILERSLKMCAQDTGIISVLIPASILTNKGSSTMRKHLLDKNSIVSLFVFENKGIFNIHYSQRFALLTVRNGGRTEKFPVGFYLHDTASLKDRTREAAKFGTVKAQDVRESSPGQYLIPEIANPAKYEAVYHKLHRLKQTLDTGHNGWNIGRSKGFDTTNDHRLFNKKQSASSAYWHVLKGENIHQFMPDFRQPFETVRRSDGLKVESKKKAYAKDAKGIFSMFRLAFRNQASDTNVRSAIAAIIPPRTFVKNSMSFLVLSRDFKRVLDDTEMVRYHCEISYLVGIINSMTFDFITRSKTLTNPVTVIGAIPLPSESKYDEEIRCLAAKLSVNGKPEFKQFADSMNIPNVLPTPKGRIEMTARLDALAARAYGLNHTEYQTILDSFKFEEDPHMPEADSIDWQASRAAPMRPFFGEVRKRAMDSFAEAGT